MRSLNGSRVADQILKLVPNVEVNLLPTSLPVAFISYFFNYLSFLQILLTLKYLTALMFLAFSDYTSVFEILGKEAWCLFKCKLAIMPGVFFSFLNFLIFSAPCGPNL